MSLALKLHSLPFGNLLVADLWGADYEGSVE